MQQHEEDKTRDLERRMRRLEEECTTADQRHLHTEVELNSFKQQCRGRRRPCRVFCFKLGCIHLHSMQKIAMANIILPAKEVEVADNSFTFFTEHVPCVYFTQGFTEV